MIEFPVLTSPTSDRKDFEDRLIEILNSDWKELIAVSPFVDTIAIQNIINRVGYAEKRLILVTRLKTLWRDQKASVRQAAANLKKVASSNPALRQRVTWYINEKLHAKFIIKDSELVLFGSQNLTYSGLRQNYELGALIRDNDSVMKARAFAEDIIKGAKEGKLFP